MGTLGFILAVAFIAIQAFNAVNKEKQARAKRVPPVFSKPELRDELEDRVEVWQQLSQNSQERSASSPFLNVDRGHIEQPTQQAAKPKKANKPVTGAARTTAQHDIHSQDTSELSPHIDNIDEVRRAIIWSEVLNRKY